MSARDLDQAYRRAHYRLLLEDGPLELRVGEQNRSMAGLLASAGVAGGAFITACNPGSRLRSPAANAAAQAALEARAAGAGHRLVPGEAVDPDGAWPAEPSVLILGIGRADAGVLAGEFGQNALLWIGADGEPELVWITSH